jgi:ATP-dependent DNA helicase RecQ
MLTLRPFQKNALAALASPSTHLLCISPTGSGKSLIYERLAARPGTRTLLVTPLIALARQQLERLGATGIPVTAAIGRISNPVAPPPGRSGAWIVSPESLLVPSRARLLEKWAPDFLVVDECHCLWEWGESFRPAFHLLPRLLESRTITHSLWLTATLPPHARTALRVAFQTLGLPLVEHGSFALPPSLVFEAPRIEWPERSTAFIHKISELQELGAGLVFAQTREGCERLARLLRETGIRVTTYHAGLAFEERRNASRRIAEQKVDVIVATSAFGMGMDYPHLRWVLLWQAPPSLLNLAQAIGRAGRSASDPARACVFWDADDFQLIDWMTHGSERRKDDLNAVAHFLKEPGCRAASLENFFNGESDPKHRNYCGRCDHCERRAS